MAIQTINIGRYPNDGTGDDLRAAFEKVNSNFSFIQSNSGVAGGVNLGTGTGLYVQRTNGNLEFKSLTSTDNSVLITNTTNTVNLQSVPRIQNESNPTLGDNLELNGYNITSENGGDIRAPVFGIDVKSLAKIIELMVYSGSVSIDMGSFLYPAGSDLDIDFGGITTNIYNQSLDFGVLA